MRVSSVSFALRFRGEQSQRARATQDEERSDILQKEHVGERLAGQDSKLD